MNSIKGSVEACSDRRPTPTPTHSTHPCIKNWPYWKSNWFLEPVALLTPNGWVTEERHYDNRAGGHTGGPGESVIQRSTNGNELGDISKSL